MILDDDPIPVGLLSPRTGVLEGFGAGAEHAAQLAIDEVNDAGGPMNREIELHIEDTETDRGRAVDAFDRLVDDDIVACLGPLASSTHTTELSDRVSEANVMQVTLSLYPDIATQGFATVEDHELKFIGRPTPNDLQMGISAAYVLNEILTADTAWFGWWEPPEERMLTRAEELFDGEVIDWWESAFHGVTEFDDVVEADPDAYVYFGTDQEHHLEGLTNAGYDGDIVFYRGFNWIDLDEYGDLADGVYSVESRPEPTDGTDAFEQTFEDTFDGQERPMVAEMYDAVMLVALALQRAGESDGPAIAEHIQKISTAPGEHVTFGDFDQAKSLLQDEESVHYIGVSGHVDLSERLEPVYPQAIMQVQDGEAVDVETLSADFFEGKLYDL